MDEKRDFRTFEDLECWQACWELRRFSAKIGTNQPNNGETKTRSYNDN